MKHQEYQQAKQYFLNAMLAKRISKKTKYRLPVYLIDKENTEGLQKEIHEIKQRLSTLESLIIV